jgi:hypothetical protein
MLSDHQDKRQRPARFPRFRSASAARGTIRIVQMRQGVMGGDMARKLPRGQHDGADFE